MAQGSNEYTYGEFKTCTVSKYISGHPGVWSTHDHLGLRVDSTLKLVKVDRPLTSRRGSGSSIRRRVKRHVTDSTTRHLDVADVPARVSID